MINKKNGLFFLTIVSFVIFHQYTVVHAMENTDVSEDNASCHSVSSPQRDSNDTNRTSSKHHLDKFYQEMLKTRHSAIRTERTIIAPTASEDIDAIYELLTTETSDTYNFVDVDKLDRFYHFKKDKVAFLSDIYQTLGQGKSGLIDYSIFSLDENNKLILVGQYSMKPPTISSFSPEEQSIFDKGRYVSTFKLFPNFRGKGFGKEVKNSIYDHIVKPLIGSTPYIYRMQGNIYDILREDDGRLNGPNFTSYAKRKKIQDIKFGVEKADFVFKGLQGLVDKRNKASIALNEKCGWKVARECSIKGTPSYLFYSP